MPGFAFGYAVADFFETQFRKNLVEPMGIEPTTSALRTLRSPN